MAEEFRTQLAHIRSNRRFFKRYRHMAQQVAQSEGLDDDDKLDRLLGFRQGFELPTREPIYWNEDGKVTCAYPATDVEIGDAALFLDAQSGAAP